MHGFPSIFLFPIFCFFRPDTLPSLRYTPCLCNFCQFEEKACHRTRRSSEPPGERVRVSLLRSVIPQ